MAMITLRCADVTLQHGYRYFAVTEIRDLGTQLGADALGGERRGEGIRF